MFGQEEKRENWAENVKKRGYNINSKNIVAFEFNKMRNILSRFSLIFSTKKLRQIQTSLKLKEFLI